MYGSHKQKSLVLALVITPLCVALAAPVLTGPALAADKNAPLIDKETEGLMRKLITKRFCKRVSATSEQKEKIESLFAATAEQTRPLREQMRHQLLDLSALMSSSDASTEAIQNQVKAVRATREQLMDQRLDAALKLRTILSVDQRQKIHQRVTDILSGDFTPPRIGFLLNR